ncbi:MAG: nuclear transport factor 2 family protein [Anaerolineales bacterium]|nr:nuclear transport factor 2 family protein [Anaerolineales bacterium]
MLTGKGMFIWKIQYCHNGNINEIIDKAVKANYSHVLIKIANGIYSYNYDWEKKIDLVPPLVQALKSKGIEAWGWHYLFGDQPGMEAQKAISRIRELGVDGYVLDAEGHYKGKYSAANTFMSQLRAEINDIPVALSSYRYPSYHPQLPWDEFLKKCDLNMPQVYWMQAHNPGAQLKRSVAEFQNLTYSPPIFPTGAAFTEWGWTPTASEVKEFMKKAQSLNLSGINFWEWSNLHKALPVEIWHTIRDFEWDKDPQPPDDIAELLIQELNSHNSDRVQALYRDQAVHITSERTAQGKEAIKSWYAALFTDILPDAVFNLASFTGTGNIRHISWTANSSIGNVQNGSDTIGLKDGKIAYHFSEFTVTK